MSPRPLSAWLLVFTLFLPEAPAQQPRTDAAGDPLPRGALLRLGSARFRQGNPVSFVAYSPDGKLLVSASLDDLICVWDAATGRNLCRIPARTHGRPPAQFSADGKTLVVLGEGGALCRHDARTGELLARLTPLPGAVDDYAFGAHGTLAAVLILDQPLSLLDTATGKELRTLPVPGPDKPGQELPVLSFFSFAEDGKTVLAALDHKDKRVFHFWDAATGKHMKSLEKRTLDPIPGLPLSPDGKYLATRAGSQSLTVTNLATGKETRLDCRGDGGPSALAFSADGKLLAWSDSEGLRVARPADGKVVGEFPGVTPAVLAFSPDAAHLAAGGRDGVLRIWDVAGSREVVVNPSQAGIVTTMALSSNGKLLFTAGSDRTFRLWDLHSGKEVRRFDLPRKREDDPQLAEHVPMQATFTAEGRAVAAAWSHGAMVLWNVATGKERPHDPRRAFGSRVFAFSPEGRLLAFAEVDAQIVLRDVVTGRDVRRLTASQIVKAADMPPSPPYEALAFSADGRSLFAELTSGADGEFPDTPAARVWELATGKERASFRFRNLPGGSPYLPAESRMRDFLTRDVLDHSPEASTLAPAANGKLLARSAAGEVRLFDLAGGREFSRLSNASGLPGSSAFSPDGRLLAVPALENEVALWDIAEGIMVGLARGHGGLVTAVQFTPDGKRLLTASADMTVLIWDVAALCQRDATTPRVAPAQLERWWQTLGQEDAEKAYQAVWGFVTTSHESAAFLRLRLRPAVGVAPAKLNQLIADLDGKEFAVRRRAVEELEKLSDLAEAALEKALEGRPSLEVRQRIVQLLEKARGVVRDPERLRVLRGLEVLELIGNAEARHVLEEVSKGAAEARLTQEAKRVLERLAARKAGR